VNTSIASTSVNEIQVKRCDLTPLSLVPTVSTNNLGPQGNVGQEEFKSSVMLHRVDR